MRAEKVQKIAATLGLDFSNIDQIVDKIAEEVSELIKAKPSCREMEAGDILFSVINLLRHLEIESEVALGKSTSKFCGRVEHVIVEASQRSIDTTTMTEQIFEQLWTGAKKNENR